MPADGTVPLARLRATVAMRVQTHGLRPVARELGLDPKSVKAFLAGARPRTSTQQRLEESYVRWSDEASGETDPTTAGAAFRVLLSGIPPSMRPRAWEDAAAAIQQIYRRHGIRVPAWLGLTAPSDTESDSDHPGG